MSAPSPRTPSFRLHLREATRSEHLALDAAMSSLDLAAAADYSRFLRIHLDALRLLSAHFRAEDQFDFDNLIRCARHDLAKFGRSGMTPALGQPGASDLALGVGYVIRGSRLGARVLRQRIPTGFPTTFLDYVMHLPWADFVVRLDEFGASASAAARAAVLEGARQAFEVYRDVIIRRASRVLLPSAEPAVLTAGSLR